MKRPILPLLIVATALFAGIALADSLDVPIIEPAGDGQMANCSTSTVSGLKPGPDAILAVRSGPGSQYRKLDELHNGEVVTVFEDRGGWADRLPYRECALRCTESPPGDISKEGLGQRQMAQAACRLTAAAVASESEAEFLPGTIDGGRCWLRPNFVAVRLDEMEDPAQQPSWAPGVRTGRQRDQAKR